MGARDLLSEILQLLRAQNEAVVARNHQALLEGAAVHERLLQDLDTAELDATPEELQAIATEIEREKTKLQSLLTAEGQRVDFLLRLYIGGAQPKAATYKAGWRPEGRSGKLNRRT